MSSKTFNVLMIVTTVLLVVAFLVGSQSRDLVLEFIRGQDLLPAVDTDRLTGIIITKGGDEEKKVELQKQGSQFLVVSRESFPADGGRINNLLQQCTGITCDRSISESADVHAELEVDGKAAESIVVKFMAGETELVGVVLGKTEGSGRYVRLTNSDEVFLSEESVFVDTDALAYVDKDLTKLEQIKKVSVRGGGNNYIVEKSGDGQPELQGIPEGMVAKASAVTQVFNVCSSLTFADFYSESSIKDVTFDRTYVAETEGGVEITLQLGKRGEDMLCKATARYVGPKQLSEEEIKAAKDDPEKTKQYEATMQAGRRIQSFNARNQSWVYKIAKFNADNLVKKFEDLTEEDKNFLSGDSIEVGAVKVTKGAESYEVEAPKGGFPKLKSVPEGKAEQPFQAETVAQACTSLSWTNRLKPDDAKLKDVSFDTAYEATTRDNIRYTFQLAKKDNQNFAKVAASFVGDAADASPEAKIAKDRVAKFQARHQGHVYEVGPGGVDNMSKGLKDLVRDPGEQPKEIAASHILVSFKGADRASSERTEAEAKTRAEEILKQVQADGADFAKIAAKESDGPSKTKGGDLGRFGFASMAKEFSEAAFKLKVGEMSGVVKSPFGFHIIKRTR